jgi:rhodanese-related sulfurtransferase
MKEFIGLVIRSLIIAVMFAVVGLGTNVLSSKSIPWLYIPPRETVVSGIKVPLVNERTAHGYFDDPGTTFIDARLPKDYAESHVKGSIELSPKNFVDRFPRVQPLLPQKNRIVLYCYGPECDMAERVALSLVDLGYKKLIIMSSGFSPWQAAGYPVEGSLSKGRSKRAGLSKEKR